MTTLHDHHRPRKFWKLLPEREKQVLRQIARPVRYAGGTRIFAEGEESKFALLIEVGAVKVTQRRLVGDGLGELVAIRTVDELVGEGVWSEDQRNATVVALCEVRALRIEAADFAAFLSEFREAELALRRTARDRSDDSLRKMLDPRNTSSRRQLARILIELTDSFGSRARGGSSGYEVDLGLSQAELGQLIGFSERTVHRVLADWRRRGLVSIDDRRVIIHDDVSLRRIAGWSRH
ncbi:MAG TPA: Crp/Fnr family transcriptional regulator [Streptosporangiaceae bacterium]|nr:Crp/Fnr family transcriptional regulator [Streptosporangiaceae bacterium]